MSIAVKSRGDRHRLGQMIEPRRANCCSGRTRRRALPLLVVLIAAMVAAPAAAASSDAAIAKIKAAFLFNFVKFLVWPEDAFESPESPIVIAVIGDEGFARVVAGTVADQRFDSRSLSVLALEFPPLDRLSEERRREALAAFRQRLGQSHMAYVASSQEEHLQAILRASPVDHVVFVGEGKRLASRGTMLALERDDDRIVLFANREAIAGSTTKVSSKLLQLAKTLDPQK